MIGEHVDVDVDIYPDLDIYTKNYHDSLLKVISRENAPTSNPFAAAPDSGPEETPNILDLFGVGGGQADTVGFELQAFTICKTVACLFGLS